MTVTDTLLALIGTPAMIAAPLFLLAAPLFLLAGLLTPRRRDDEQLVGGR